MAFHGSSSNKSAQNDSAGLKMFTVSAPTPNDSIRNLEPAIGAIQVRIATSQLNTVVSGSVTAQGATYDPPKKIVGIINLNADNKTAVICTPDADNIPLLMIPGLRYDFWVTEVVYANSDFTDILLLY